MEMKSDEVRNEEIKRGEMSEGFAETNSSDKEQGVLMKQLAEAEYPEKILESAQPFMELMSRYRCAMM